MGAEAKCTAKIKGKTVKGTARLETDAVEFRGGDVRLTIRFAQMKGVAATDGTLTLTVPGGPVTLALGPAAQKWAQKILHPPSRLEKLGVRPEWRASVVGVDDESFISELREQVASLTIGRAAKRSDAIFFGATRAAQLGRLARLRAALKPDGALWVVRPKGRPEISESAVMAAGKAAGLVDVKVISFSATHTAEKFVIPVKDR